MNRLDFDVRGSEGKPMSTDPASIPIEIDVRNVKSMMDTDEDFLLLDVREQAEYNFVHIDGAVLTPLSEIQNRISALEPHRERHIVVHCHKGGRSLQVTQWLRTLGFSSVQNMTGGIDAWSLSMDASLPRYQ